LYFDRNFGRRFPDAVRRADPPFTVEYHHDPKNKFKFKFKDNTPDDEWLSKVGAEGWVVLSHDRKWHNESPNIAAIKQHNIGCFYLWGANSTTWEKLSCFVRGYGKIANAITHAPRPFIFHLHLNCSLTRIKIP
jgi:hypothetical protein